MPLHMEIHAIYGVESADDVAEARRADRPAEADYEPRCLHRATHALVAENRLETVPDGG